MMEDASKARLSFSKQLSVNMLMVMEFMPRLAPRQAHQLLLTDKWWIVRGWFV